MKRKGDYNRQLLNQDNSTLEKKTSNGDLVKEILTSMTLKFYQR